MKVLIAEDSDVSRQFLERALIKWGYEVVSVPDGGAAWDILQGDTPPRLAILDWMMPVLNGVEICQKVRSLSSEPYIYILLLTAKDQKEDLVQAMKAGADDYVVKPFDPEELSVRLRAGKRIVELQEQLMSAREALRVQATYDSLTDLLNRRAILDILGRELNRAKRQGKTVGIAMVDLDHFKKVNDTYGHTAGDAVLLEAAKRMASSLRIYDAIGRYGGEEFLIVLPECSKRGALVAAERIRSCICKKPIAISQKSVTVEASLGVTVADSETITDVESLIKIADKALYKAKDSGRNRVEYAGIESVLDIQPVAEGHLETVSRENSHTL